MAFPASASEFNEQFFIALTPINDRSVNTTLLGRFSFRRRSRHRAWMLRATGVGVRRRLRSVRCSTGCSRRVAYRYHAISIGCGLICGSPDSIAKRRSCDKAGRSLRVEVACIHPASQKAAPSARWKSRTPQRILRQSTWRLSRFGRAYRSLARRPSRRWSAVASSRSKRTSGASPVVPCTRTSAIWRIHHSRCASNAAQLSNA